MNCSALLRITIYFFRPKILNICYQYSVVNYEQLHDSYLNRLYRQSNNFKNHNSKSRTLFEDQDILRIVKIIYYFIFSYKQLCFTAMTKKSRIIVIEFFQRSVLVFPHKISRDKEFAAYDYIGPSDVEIFPDGFVKMAKKVSNEDQIKANEK